MKPLGWSRSGVSWRSIPPEKSGGSVEAFFWVPLVVVDAGIPPEKSGGSVEATLDHHSHTPNL